MSPQALQSRARGASSSGRTPTAAPQRAPNRSDGAASGAAAAAGTGAAPLATEPTGGMDEILGVMEALGQAPAPEQAGSDHGGGESGEQQQAPAPAPGHPAAPAAAAAGTGGRDSGDRTHDAFYRSWRVRRHRPGSPEHTFSQPGAKGEVVSCRGAAA